MAYVLFRCRIFVSASLLLPVLSTVAADIYRSLFKFGVFNAVQSTCFDHVVNETDNLVRQPFYPGALSLSHSLQVISGESM